MRISGISSMYGMTGISPVSRSNGFNVPRTGSTRVASTSRTGRAYGVNQSYGNKAYGSSSTYGTARNYATLAAQKADAIYEGTKNATASLRVHGQNLMDSGKDSLAALAKEKGSTKEYTAEVTNFIDSYNEMVKNMSSAGGTMNELYAQQLKSNYSDHQEELAAVGITAAKDGTLQINQEALEKADISALEKAFGSTDSFAGKTSTKSIYVEANAVSEQAASRYAKFGNMSYGSIPYSGYGYGNYGSYGSIPYSGYGGYSNYGLSSALGSYGSYGNYSALGSYLGMGGYGGGYGSGSLAGALFNSLF